MKWLFWGFLASLAWVGPDTVVATRPSAQVTFRGDDVLYQGARLSGVLEERFDAVGTVRRTSYRDGRAHGVEEERTFAGPLVARRVFARGRKVGVHEGWFASGARRFRHEFTDGRHDGEVWEWYEAGALATYARFERGKLLGKKVWRESGQIYMNYVFAEQQEYGLPGTKLCYQVRK